MNPNIEVRSDRDLLENFFRLTPAKAATSLRKTRQALYSKLNSSRDGNCFKPAELSMLYVTAAQEPGADIRRGSFLEYVNRTRKPADAKKVVDALTVSLGAFKEVWLILADLPLLLREHSLVRDGLLDIVRESQGRQISIFVPMMTDAALLETDLVAAGIKVGHIDWKEHSAVNSLPPMAIADPDGRAEVFMLVEGEFKKSNFFGGARLATLLRSWVEPKTFDALKSKAGVDAIAPPNNAKVKKAN